RPFDCSPRAAGARHARAGDLLLLQRVGCGHAPRAPRIEGLKSRVHGSTPSRPQVEDRSMGTNDEIIERYKAVVRSDDLAEVSRFLTEVAADDFVQEWPQSG